MVSIVILNYMAERVVYVKVILKEDVKSLGKKEQLVEVSDGYGRNYLLPKGLAVEATSANMNVMKTKKEAEATKKSREVENAEKTKQLIHGKEVILKIKAGENGKIFGSIGSNEIAEKIRKVFKIDIDKRKINLNGNIKTLGITEVEIRLYPSISAKINLKVEQE